MRRSIAILRSVHRAGPYVVTPNQRYVVPGETAGREIDLFAIGGAAIDDEHKHWLLMMSWAKGDTVVEHHLDVVDAAGLRSLATGRTWSR
ncbi:MAG TPA: hypothetical protein VMJ10_23355 [Kofleriaceae bacterium]|nr:hypothetical protein [Kofleriaceae bacterium]